MRGFANTLNAGSGASTMMLPTTLGSGGRERRDDTAHYEELALRELKSDPEFRLTLHRRESLSPEQRKEFEGEYKRFDNLAKNNNRKIQSKKKNAKSRYTPRQNYIRALIIEAIIKKFDKFLQPRSNTNTISEEFNYSSNNGLYQALSGSSLLKEEAGSKAAKILDREFKPPEKTKKQYDIKKEITRFNELAKQADEKRKTANRRFQPRFTEKQNYLRRLIIEALIRSGKGFPNSGSKGNDIGKIFGYVSDKSLYKSLAGETLLKDNAGKKKR